MKAQGARGAGGERSRLAQRLLPATVVATFSLILLGIYTAAIAAGLACDARWPLCDGAVFGLFPANWPSFVEWFHRLVALVTGFMILGSWWAVRRGRPSRKALAAISVAAGLLPVQILLGAGTVLSYEVLTLIAHFLTALVIFAGVVLGWVWTVGPAPGEGWSRRLLLGALVLFIPFVVLTPRFLFIHTGRVQVAYYALGLAIFGALLVVAALSFVRSPGPTAMPAVGVLASAGTFLLAGQLLAGRLVRSPTVNALDWAGAAATLLVLLLAAWLVTGRESGRPGGRGSPGPWPSWLR